MSDPSMFDMFTMLNDSIRNLNPNRPNGRVEIPENAFNKKPPVKDPYGGSNIGNPDYNPITDPNFVNRGNDFALGYMNQVTDFNSEMQTALNYEQYGNLFKDEEYKKVALKGGYSDSSISIKDNYLGKPNKFGDYTFTLPNGEVVKINKDTAQTYKELFGFDIYSELKKADKANRSSAGGSPGNPAGHMFRTMEQKKNVEKLYSEIAKKANAAVVVDKNTKNLTKVGDLKSTLYADVVKSSGGVRGLFERAGKGPATGTIGEGLRKISGNKQGKAEQAKIIEALKGTESFKALNKEKFSDVQLKADQEFSKAKTQSLLNSTNINSTILNSAYLGEDEENYWDVG